MTFWDNVSLAAQLTYRTESTYGHHGAAAGAGDEDLGSIGLVVGNGPGDHVCNSVAVTSSVVAQCCLAADIPACSRVR